MFVEVFYPNKISTSEHKRLFLSCRYSFHVVVSCTKSSEIEEDVSSFSSVETFHLLGKVSDIKRIMFYSFYRLVRLFYV